MEKEVNPARRLPLMIPQELTAYFKEQECIFDLKSDNKRDALAEMVDRVCKEHRIKDKEIIIEMLLNRESLGSTAIGKGVAFPHGRTLAIQELSLLFARSTKGIDFDAVDKKPTHLFFLIIAPPQDKDNLYLQVLGQMVDLIKDEKTRKKFMSASGFEELRAILQSFS
jgi:mannitol/fructose-specific phosphotransferase system IIA component (Ntr-type)